MFGMINHAGHPVPLKSIDVTVNIKGCLAQVESSLGYSNEEDDPVEVTFTFPMDDESAVYHFEAHIDGRYIVAEIQENDEAIQTYEDAIKHRKTAMLLKEDKRSGDTFQCLLGNLPAHSEAQLMIKYIIKLPQQYDGKVKFSLPTVLNPRYSPDAGHSVAADLAEYVPPNKIRYHFSLRANVEGYRKVISITSEKIQLNIQYTRDNKVAKVTLAEEFKFDHDLNFLVEYENPYSPQVVLEAGDPETDGLLQEDILMVNFYPDLKTIDVATCGEYVFIIDRSGSMSGTTIQDAKVALLLCIKSLPLGCFFNIISFGSGFTSLFEGGSQQYNDDNLETALQLQSAIEADMGGTEILRPLEHVYQNNCIEGHPRRIIVLTDGGVERADKVIALVRKHASTARVFALGIGSGVSTTFLKGIARAGGGEAVFIADQDRLQPQVLSLLKNAIQPCVTDIEIKLELPDGVTPIMIPSEPPHAITAGNTMTVFALLKGVDHESNFTGTVVLNGKMDAESVLYSMPFMLSNMDVDKAAPVHRLATKTQIKLLQDEEGDINEGFHAVLMPNEIRQKIVNLSRCGNIISKYTAFVAIDKKSTMVEGELMQRSCPVPSLANLGELNLLSAQQSIPMVEISGNPPPIPYREEHDPGMLNRELFRGLQQLLPIRHTSTVMYCTAPHPPSKITNLNKEGFVYADLKFRQPPKDKGKMDTEAKTSAFYKKSSSSYFADYKCSDSKTSSIMDEDFDCNKTNLNKEGFVYADLKFRQPPKDKGKMDTEAKTSAFYKKSSSSYFADYKCSDSKTSSIMAEDFDCNKMTCKMSLPATIKTTMPSYRRLKLYQGMDALSPEEAILYKKMIEVINYQEIYGQWEKSDQLMLLLEVSIHDLEIISIVKDFNADIVCTLAVIAWLRTHFLKHHNEWEMIEKKALSWLSAQNLETSIEGLLSQLADALWSK